MKTFIVRLNDLSGFGLRNIAVVRGKNTPVGIDITSVVVYDADIFRFFEPKFERFFNGLDSLVLAKGSDLAKLVNKVCTSSFKKEKVTGFSFSMVNDSVLTVRCKDQYLGALLQSFPILVNNKPIKEKRFLFLRKHNSMVNA